MIYGSRLWPYNVPFVKGGPRAQVSKEVWGPQKQESQESAGQKQSMALVQKHTANLNTPAQNVRDSIREPTVSTVAVVGLTPKPKKLPTPVKIEVLNELLTGYEKGEIKYLVSGFKNGFRLGYTGERVSRQSKNLIVCQEKPEEVQKKIQKEIDLGRIEGPFKEPPFQSCFIISPIGVVPKSEPGQYRLIQHLSYPEKTSINDGIAEEFKTVGYASIDDAISKIKIHGSQALMCKTDIDSAFRLIPIKTQRIIHY